MNDIQEFKDKAGKHRVRVVNTVGKDNITYSSTQGYANKQDMIDAIISSCKSLLEKYDKD